MLAVATTEEGVVGLCRRLEALGAVPIEVKAPGASRRVVLATVADERRVEPLAVVLRSEGEMAVARPDGGPSLEAWHRDTRPVTFDDRLTVCVAWSEHERSARPGLLELGPGGFGNARHPTTALIIEELARRLRGGERVLDVGCGSGVLGLGAVVLGAARVVAVDRKPEAVEATLRNAALNAMDGRVEATVAAVADVEGVFDAVVANIARAGIVALARELVARVGEGGWLAVSGITPSQCGQVAEFLKPLVEVTRRTSGDWSMLVLARDPTPPGRGPISPRRPDRTTR